MVDLLHPLKPPLQNSSAPRDKEPKDDIEKLLKWQEDRLAKKLRGEYESAVIHLSELINSNLHTSMNISSVRVEGANNTRQSFLGWLIKPSLAQALPTSEKHCDLESVLHTTRRIADTLKRTDIFTSVEAKIERAGDDAAAVGDVDVVFKTRERGRLYLNSSTEVGNNEGSASATARVRNVFGGAEMFEANLSLGTKTRRSFRGSLSAPLTADLETFGEVSVFGLERDNSSFASSFEGLRGAKAVVRSGQLHRGTHELAYEAVARHIAGLMPTASISIREAAGQTFKSSLSHTFVLDTRDDRITSTQGVYAKLFNELAGLGGDASFYKVEAEGQISRPLWDGVSISFAARTGLLHSIGKPTLFSDRFQLGGPTSIRSFRANSMGPCDGSDYVGGDIYYSAGASIISNIPKKPHWPIKTHLWVNTGRLDTLDKSCPLTDSICDMLSHPSISAGVSLIYCFDPA
ncbi:surface antigen-domain-containing protein [Crucibulum laeve]|uniref:Surface antigen-domain-containing protein n=1 Tax=Crucibulum laeve TaxID=68775 RepID=A0A5C3M858_9AGAR|nr:surface antigen-domain-containing protein [Crucibulum laeve]